VKSAHCAGGTQGAQWVDTVSTLIRRLFAVLLFAALLGPAAGAVCAGGGCGSAASEHACCETPVITQCGCAQGHDASEQSEPARRAPNTMPALTLVAVPSTLHPLAPAHGAAFRADAAPPPLDTGDRLSLLSILVV